MPNPRRRPPGAVEHGCAARELLSELLTSRRSPETPLEWLFEWIEERPAQ